MLIQADFTLIKGMVNQKLMKKKRGSCTYSMQNKINILRIIEYIVEYMEELCILGMYIVQCTSKVH